jgi:hypothetical protein
MGRRRRGNSKNIFALQKILGVDRLTGPKAKQQVRVVQVCVLSKHASTAFMPTKNFAET